MLPGHGGIRETCRHPQLPENDVAANSSKTDLLVVSDQVAGHSPPGRTLDNAYRYCDPRLSLAPESDAKIHADLSALRGGDRLAVIRRAIRRAGGDLGSLHLLTGHMGSGKTTELRRLAYDLGNDELKSTVVYFDAEALLRLPVADLEDILIGLWLVLAGDGPQALADTVPLPGNVSARARTLLQKWWQDKIHNQLVKLSSDLPGALVDGLRTVLAQLKGASPEEKSPWRVAMRPLAQTFIDGMNEAIAELRKDDGPPVIFVIDQLEKLSPGPHVATLYGQRLIDLKQLHAHVILTVPLYLCYDVAGSELVASVYGTGPVVLPMVKVSMRRADGGGPYDPGIQALANLLLLRVDFVQLFDDGPEAARDIAKLSGGSVRHALQLTQGAINMHDTPKVTRASIDLTAAEMTAAYERSLPDGWVDEVAYVHLHDAFRPACAADIKGALLYGLYVLEYKNGEPAPWHAVHPLVLATQKVQAALRARVG